MWKVFVKDAKSLQSKSNNPPDSYIRMVSIGAQNYYFAKTGIIKKSKNPAYDENGQKPFYFPECRGFGVLFKIYDHRVILHDRFIGQAYVQLDKVEYGKDIKINVDCKYLPEDVCYLTIMLVPPTEPLLHSPFTENDNILTFFLIFDPPINEIPKNKLIELSFIHASVYEGEIHQVIGGQDHFGLKSTKDHSFKINGCYTQVFEIDLPNFNLGTTFGYKGRDACMFMPCIFSRSSYVGRVIINVAASVSLPPLIEKEEYINVRHNNTNNTHIFETIEYSIENNGIYAGGIIFDSSKREFVRYPVKYSEDAQVPLVIQDLSYNLLPPDIRLWTRLNSSSLFPITFQMAVSYHRIEWPINFKFEIGWKQYIHNINIFMIPYSDAFTKIKNSFWTYDFQGIKHKHGQFGRDSESYNKMDGEKAIIKTQELDPSIKYIAVTAYSYVEEFKDVEGLYVRITDKATKVELSFTPLQYSGYQALIGIMFKLPNGLWDFQPTFDVPYDADNVFIPGPNIYYKGK